MGRKPVISRDALLDLAEGIVRKDGAGALTIGALAEAGGISKGGVQYSFAAKDDIIRALIDRWTEQTDKMLAQVTDGDPVAFLRQYIASVRQSDQFIDAKVAGLMMLYIKNPENLRRTQEWYQSVFARLQGDDLRSRSARVAFLAVEGLFLMRINGLENDGAWSGFLDDVEDILAHMCG